MKRAFRIIIGVCILAQIFGLYQIIAGSQEMFPTPEQEGAVRISGLMLISFTLIIELLIWKFKRWQS